MNDSIPAAVAAPPTRTAPFFVIVLGFTLILQAPQALAPTTDPNDPRMMLVALGALGPLLAAIVAAGLEVRQGGGGVRALFARFRRGTALAWWPIALLLFPACWLLGRVVAAPVVDGNVPWLYPPENAQHIIAMAMFPLVEEIGWRGFALPRLLARYGPARATVLLGVAWAAWHTMMFLAVGTDPMFLALGYVNILVGSVLFTWLFLRTRGSLWLAVLAHVGAHLNNPSHAGVTSLAPMTIYTAALAVVANAVVVLDRAAWRAPATTTAAAAA